jgi:hypothetical protein
MVYKKISIFQSIDKKNKAYLKTIKIPTFFNLIIDKFLKQMKNIKNQS